ncbi:MAG: hypothetical protein LIP28_08620, partial [Deltaproteobacteria bacterium]|nr:hypothetical protein [Deltaproteobacteria bacterium]
DRDAATVLRLVRQNPFWMGGREILAQSLEKRGLYEEAVLFRIELAEIEPVVSRYRDLLRLAPFLRDTPWLRMAEEHLATMSRYKNSPEDTRDQIAAARRLFRNGRDQLLEEAFAAKRREWFPGK